MVSGFSSRLISLFILLVFYLRSAYRFLCLSLCFPLRRLSLVVILYLHRITHFCFGCNIAGLSAHLEDPAASSAFRTKYRARTKVYMPSPFYQLFLSYHSNKKQLPAHADSCLVCKTRMNSYLRFITSLTFSMMWRPMSLEASTVCAPMWGLMTKLSQEKSGLWNSSLPLRPLPASSFSITSAA